MTFDFTTIDWRVVLAALAIVVTVVVAFYFQWWRTRKNLSYEIVSRIELASADTDITDKVEILYEGEPVKNVQLLIIRLMNDGYQPIKKDEFEKPIRFIFPHARILTAEKDRFQPDNIDTRITYEESSFEITPALFNRKDYVQFKIILSGSTEMKSDARIVGVSNISRNRKRANRTMAFFGFLTGVLFTGVPFTVIAPPSRLGNTIAMIIAVIWIFFLFRLFILEPKR